jgi:hypothetical protein
LLRRRAVAVVNHPRIARLNRACGPTPAAGRIDADRLRAPGIARSGDIRARRPRADDVVDYAVAIHGLQDLAYLDVVPALQELRRVLRPQGLLRLGLPDLDRALAACARRGQLLLHSGCGSDHAVHWELARELLLRSGDRRVARALRVSSQRERACRDRRARQSRA